MLPIEILGDGQAEGAEQFSIRIVSAHHATVADEIGAIIVGDPPVARVTS